LNDMKYENAANKTETGGPKTMGSKIIIPKKKRKPKKIVASTAAESSKNL